MDVNNIIASMQLIGTSVRHLKLDNILVSANRKDKLDKKLDVTYDINELYASEDKNIGSLILHINLNIEEEKKECVALKLDIEGGFIFKFNEDVDEENRKRQMEMMLSHNGCATLYSIARAFIISLTGQMCNEGTIILPMINVYKLNENKEQNNK